MLKLNSFLLFKRQDPWHLIYLNRAMLLYFYHLVSISDVIILASQIEWNGSNISVITEITFENAFLDG